MYMFTSTRDVMHRNDGAGKRLHGTRFIGLANIDNTNKKNRVSFIIIYLFN